MTSLLVVWLGIGIAIMLLGARPGRPSAGMPLAYFLELSLIHTPGAAAFLGSARWNLLAQYTYMGYLQTIIGLLAFLIGVLAIRAFVPPHPSAERHWTPEEFRALDKLAVYYLLGGVAFFGMSSLFAIPSLGAFVAAISFLLAVGWSLRLWIARKEKNGKKFWLTVAVLPILPVLTIVKLGFVGFGTFWVIAVVSFISAQSKQRLVQFFVWPLIIFAGLSLFVTYMEGRTKLRQAIWFQQVDTTERFERVFDTFSNFKWFDPDDRMQREAIVGRLNQNLYVGYAIERLHSGAVGYAYGSTLGDIAAAIIPRALWPDKPQVGGGGDVVTNFTGISFANGTSVGAGQVLEFYVNFGTAGVIGGFAIFGLLIGWLDMQICKSLIENNQKSYLRSYMVCLAFMQPGGNLVEIAVSAVGSAVTSTLISSFALKYIYRETQKAAYAPPTRLARGQSRDSGHAKSMQVETYRNIARVRGGSAAEP